VSNSDSRLDPLGRPNSDTPRRLPCCGCDLSLTQQQAAGYVEGCATKRIAPLCSACKTRALDDGVFTLQLQACVDTRVTLPTARAACARRGVEMPVTVAGAMNTLREIEAGRAAR